MSVNVIQLRQCFANSMNVSLAMIKPAPTSSCARSRGKLILPRFDSKSTQSAMGCNIITACCVKEYSHGSWMLACNDNIYVERRWNWRCTWKRSMKRRATSAFRQERSQVASLEFTCTSWWCSLLFESKRPGAMSVNGMQSYPDAWLWALRRLRVDELRKRSRHTQQIGNSGTHPERTTCWCKRSRGRGSFKLKSTGISVFHIFGRPSSHSSPRKCPWMPLSAYEWDHCSCFTHLLAQSRLGEGVGRRGVMVQTRIQLAIFSLNNYQNPITSMFVSPPRNLEF